MSETLTGRDPFGSSEPRSDPSVPALVILWSLQEPERVGEVLLLEVPECALGRGEGPGHRLSPVQQRPGLSRPTGPLRSPRISRSQIEIKRAPGGLEVHNVGRCPLLVDGVTVQRLVAAPGSILELKNELLLLVTERAQRWPAPRTSWPAFAFGGPDPMGLVGESPAAWALREQIAFAAARKTHLLLRGESGTGKELVGRALHALSPRHSTPLISRNAATLPEGLIDAELFGNIRDYPNPGMPERKGLIGEAHRGTLLLDEFAELPEAMQAHLLRVLDSGEYHRLGEGRARTADFRLIAMTNRPLDRLKHDVLARLKIQLTAPGLQARPEDIPLLTAHLLERMVGEDPELARRYFTEQGHPRISPRLIHQLVRWPWTTHARELEGLLWRAMMRPGADFLDAVPAAPAAAPEVDPNALTREQVEAALEQSQGVREKAWRLLGLRNRHQLKRLIKKFEL
jgi:DNA-binding NtrC family response regulator